MAGVALVAHQSNGIHPQDPSSSSSSLLHIAQYEKILSLRDELVAGRHPRLKLQDTFTLNEAPNGFYQSAPTNTPQLPEKIAPHASAVSLNHNIPHNSLTAYPAPTQSQLPKTAPTRQRFTAGTSSGLDPIFLEKSDVVIRAEIKLERERIEKALEEQHHTKKVGIRQKVSEQDALPDFDVTEVFFQAQDVVKPAAARETNLTDGNDSSADSVDNNSYYSSLNDSTTAETDDRSRMAGTKPCRYYFNGNCKKGDACTFSHDQAFKQKLQGAAPLTVDVDNHDSDAYPRHERAPYGSYKKSSRQVKANLQLDTREPGELIEDPPYSPADIPTQAEKLRPYQADSSREHYQNPPRGGIEESSRSLRQSSPKGRYNNFSGKRGGRHSPSHEGTVVRNHITSPVAPQPARVSPLAVSKVPQVERIRHGDNGESHSRNSRRPASGRQTPVSAQPINSKKRRREIGSGDLTRNVAPRRQAESPAPYIKSEPMSPQPFNSNPPRAQAESRVHLDLEAPPYRQGERIVYQPVRVDRSYVEGSDLRRVSSPSVRRVFSGSDSQYEIRGEPALRRVVSTRHIGRPGSPQQDLYYNSPVQPSPTIRAIPQYVQSEIESPSFYRSSVHPQSATYARSERQPSPDTKELRTVPYSPIEQERESGMMGPPQRRIVMDKYGNRYYEGPIPPERRPSVVPESRYANDFATPIQHPGSRASVRPETARVLPDGRYVQRIASPEPSPRYIEYHAPPPRQHEIITRQPIYDQDDGYRSRNEVVRLVQYPQGSVVEERYEPAPRTRMQSVRPMEIQYEVPPERQRYSTAAPESHRLVDLRRETRPPPPQYIREVSVRGDDRYSQPEYIEAKPRYQYVEAPRSGGPVSRDMDLDEDRDVDRRPLQRL